MTNISAFTTGNTIKVFSDVITGPHHLVSSKGVIWVIWTHSTELSLRKSNQCVDDSFCLEAEFKFASALPLTSSVYLWFLDSLASRHNDIGQFLEMNRLSPSPSILRLARQISPRHPPDCFPSSGIINVYHQACFFTWI